MTSYRKRKGDAAELARQRYWEALGGAVFPVSPQYRGVDLIVFLPGEVVLSEVKGQKKNLTAKERDEAIGKLNDAAWGVLFSLRITNVMAKAELVHVHKDGHEILWERQLK